MHCIISDLYCIDLFVLYEFRYVLSNVSFVLLNSFYLFNKVFSVLFDGYRKLCRKNIIVDMLLNFHFLYVTDKSYAIEILKKTETKDQAKYCII